MSLNGCLSECVSPVMNWQLIQVVSHPHPMLAGIDSSPSDPAKDKQLQIMDGWMDGWMK